LGGYRTFFTTRATRSRGNRASASQARALKSHYEAKDLLTVVDARRPMGKVTAEIVGALGHPEHPEYYASF
jgi:hypothetical protein